MPEDFKMEDVKEAIDQLGVTMKKFGVESHEYKQAVENTTDILYKQEEWNQKVTAEMAEAKKVQEEQKEQMHALELELARGGATIEGVDFKGTEEYKALTEFARHGEAKMSMDAKASLVELGKTLRTDVDTGAGYLTMPEMDTELMRQITEISNVRSVARVKTISKKVLDMPVRTGIPTATYEGEAEAASDSQSTYGNEQITAHRLTAPVPFTMDMLMDSNFDLQTEINSDVAEAMAYKEGNKFVLGTGVKQPEGFLVNATVVANADTSEGSGAISANDMTELTGGLKVDYNPMYGFNRQTLAYLRNLEDGAGNPIWQLDMSQSAPNRINGEPYIILQDMPSIAANALSVVYADFGRGYTIVDRTGLMVIRDDITYAKSAIVQLIFHKWNSGMVTLPEAFKLLKVKA